MAFYHLYSERISATLRGNRYSDIGEALMIAVRQQEQKLYWCSISAPIGEYTIIATERGVCWIGSPGTPVDEGFFRTKRWIPTYRVVKDKEAASLQHAIVAMQRDFA